jgi:group I intron endonuclease
VLIQKRCSSSLSSNRNNHNSKRLDDFLKEKMLDPVFSYEDIDLDITRKTILSETRGLSGIYLILNKVTLDYYIGSASTDRLYSRFSNHLLYFRGSKVVKYAVKKYKLPSFAFLVLELFPEVVTKENNKKLINREDFYLKHLLPNYNILTEAGSTFGYKHTEMDRLKMKINYSQERRLQIGNLNRGKKLSAETIEIIKAKTLDRPKPFISEQAILNMKKKSKPIRLYNLDRTVYGQYPSILATANAVNCDEKTVTRALATDKKILKKRYIVEFINK